MATAKFRIGQLVKDASGHDDKIHKIKSKRLDSRGYWHYYITGLSGEFPESWLKKATRKTTKRSCR